MFILKFCFAFVKYLIFFGICNFSEIFSKKGYNYNLIMNQIEKKEKIKERMFFDVGFAIKCSQGSRRKL